MRNFSVFCFHFFHVRIWKPYALCIKAITCFILFSLFIFQSKSFGQSGDISQIRNGDGKLHKVQGVDTWDTCGSCWVNGNAGASNAHYREGYSIAYNSRLTGLTPGVCYEYEIGYDTYHGAMAIDYLTHFQRLKPHGPFGHGNDGENIRPWIYDSSGTTYTLNIFLTDEFTIPAPAASGITEGVFDKNGNPKDVSGQAAASFNGLPLAERQMTMYNGDILDVFYVAQPAIVLGEGDKETRVRIRFKALSPTAILAWGGHIASRTDWGYTKNNKGDLIPLSAGGISGSPYHMRQKAMDVVDCPNGGNPIGVSSFGNQDRSLSAAAVFPPPDCPTVTSQTQCAGSTSFVFTIGSPQVDVTYAWSFGSNTVDARFSPGNTTTASGTSVTVVHNGGGAFTTAGSFSLNITAVLNAVPQECLSVATGTIEKTVVSASANPTTIVITSAAHNTTLTANIEAGSSDLTNTNYTYQWSILTAGVIGTLSNTTTRVTTFTAAPQDAGSTIAFQVTATHIGGAACVGSATTSVGVSSVGTCTVTPNATICQGTTILHSGTPNPKDANATYTWSLNAGTSSTLIGGNSGGVTQGVNAVDNYTISLSQTYANTALNTTCTATVVVIPTPNVTAVYNAPTCTQNTFSVDVPGSVSLYSYRVTQGSEGSYCYDQTKVGTGGTLNFAGLYPGGGYRVTVTTTGPGCTAFTECAGGSCPVACPESIASQPLTNANLNQEVNATDPETYKIVLNSPTKVTAVPNPFTDRIRFSMISAVSGRGSLELYNVAGQKVGIVYEGYFQSGREFIKDYNVTKGTTGSLIYVFRVGDQKVTGKLMGLK